MSKNRTATAWPAPRFPGMTFVLESTVSDVEGVKRFIKEEGGRVVPVITASVNYLLNGSRRGNKKTPEKKRADDLNQKGAAIQFLTEEQFFASLLPRTRDDALLWLESGKKGHERWRSLWNYWNDAKFTLDFNGLDFRGKDLSGCNFCAVTFIGADLSDTNLSGAYLDHLQGTHFDGACLRSATFHEASDCSFRRADLTGLNIHPNGVISNCDFTDALLPGFRGMASQLTTSVFRKADLPLAWLEESILRNNDFTAADLHEAQLARCDLTESKLVGADLRNADMRNAILVNADLRKADLRQTALADADLRGAIIDAADFRGASLFGVKVGKLDIAKARGLFEQMLAVGGVEGPMMRELAELARQSQLIQISIDLDLSGERIELSLQFINYHGCFCAGGVGVPCRRDYYPGGPINGKTVQEVMLNLAKKWHAGKLQLPSLTVTAKKCPLSKRDLVKCARGAWCEAFGVADPSGNEENKEH